MLHLHIKCQFVLWGPEREKKVFSSLNSMVKKRSKFKIPKHETTFYVWCLRVPIKRSTTTTITNLNLT